MYQDGHGKASLGVNGTAMLGLAKCLRFKFRVKGCRAQGTRMDTVCGTLRLCETSSTRLVAERRRVEGEMTGAEGELVRDAEACNWLA